MILVTGADGFIGSHVVEHLVREGEDVKALVLYNSFNSWGWLDSVDDETRASIEVVAGDVRDPAFVRSAMSGCDRVVHLAALVAIPYSYDAPRSYVDTNVGGTLNVVEAARALGVDRVVHLSTSEVYGTARSVPMDEEHALSAQSPYAASKIGADQVALSFHRSFGTPVVVVRPFNTYGPRQSARAVVPTIITQIVSGESKLKLGSLQPTRDLSYVDDTVRGILSALRSDECVGEVINLGTGFEISVGELALLVAELMGVEIKLCTDKKRVRPARSEVDRLCCDNRKAERCLGWKPEFQGRGGLERGLHATVLWFSNPENHRLYKVGMYNL